VSVLDEIIEVARKREVSIDEVELKEALGQPTRPLTLRKEGNTIIAELKYTSPSTKEVLSDDDIESIVGGYVSGGASALSVLTESQFFGGRMDFIEKVKSCCSLPILRKDFLLNTSHLKESRVLGADGVLLITAVLGDKLPAMVAKAKSLGLWSLVEVHTKSELDSALKTDAKIIGVNNRNLNSLEIDLNTSIGLSSLIPKDRLFVAESGINGAVDVEYLKSGCSRKPDAYLVGSHLMKAQDKEQALRDLVGG